jgi:predicted DNA binding protein
LIQLLFSTDAEGWVEKLCQDSSADIKVMSVKGGDQGSKRVTHFVDISSEKVSAEEIARILKNSSGITETDLARVAVNRVIGSVTSEDRGVCRALVESKTNTFIAPASTEDDCQMSYKLFISGDGLPVFLQRLHKEGISYKITDLSPLSTTRRLTLRQQKVLKSALEVGYYDFPKRVSTEHLATMLGIKSGTVAEILRRAEKNVISRYFEAAAE